MLYRRLSDSAPRFKSVLSVLLAALVASCLLIGGGCKNSGTNLGKDVLATVDGEAITVQDFRASNEGVIPSEPAERKAVLDRLINKKLAARAAVSEGLAGSPPVLNAIERFFNDRLPELLVKKIAEDTKVTDEEMGIVKGRQEQYPSVNVSLLVAPTMGEAEAALAELRKGADFNATAAKYKAVKGEAGQEFSLGDEMYPAGVRAVLNRMKAGELTPIMKIEIGYAIFRLNSRQEPEQVWKAREDSVREAMRRAKAEAERTRLIDRLRSSADIRLETQKLPGGQVQYTGATVNGIVLRMDPRLFSKVADPHLEHAGMNPKTLRDALNKRINDVLLSQEARRMGLDQDPQFQRELALAREDALADAITDKVRGAYTPTEKDMQDYYEKNKTRFMRNTQVRISRILLPTREEAEAVLKELKAGRDFAALAKSRSTDAGSKDKGGDVGMVSPGELKEPLKGAIGGLKTGAISGVLKTDYGFEILKATARVEGGPVPFATISTSIRKRVALAKVSERVEAFYDDLYKKSKVLVNEQLLSALKQ